MHFIYPSIHFQDDHPADANYYFSSGEQGRCYLAPERFYSAHQASDVSVVTVGGVSTGADKPGTAGTAGAGRGPGARSVGGLDGLVSMVRKILYFLIEEKEKNHGWGCFFFFLM